MGNTLPTQAAPQVDLRVLLQQDAPQFLYQELLGRGKFMKSLRAKHVPRDATGKTAPGESSISSEGRVVIKVYLKRGDGKEVKQRIQLAKEQLMFICGLLNLKEHPNLLPYQRFEESSRNDAVFLTRQHFMYNLYDRLNSRPFPSEYRLQRTARAPGRCDTGSDLALTFRSVHYPQPGLRSSGSSISC